MTESKHRADTPMNPLKPATLERLEAIRARAPMAAKDFRRGRQFLGLTQAELGELLGIGGGAVSRLERGARAIQPPTAFLLELVLELAGQD